MNQIRPWLYIGKYRETVNHHLLKSYGITAMLHLADRVEHPDITTLYLPVDDGVPLPIDMLEKGLTFIQEQKAQKQIIMVACGAGVSRSASFALAALKEIEHLSLLEAFKAVKNAHPNSLPHRHLWQSLCQHYDEPINWLDIARIRS